MPDLDICGEEAIDMPTPGSECEGCATKGDLASYYTKTETDELIGDVGAMIPQINSGCGVLYDGIQVNANLIMQYFDVQFVTSAGVTVPAGSGKQVVVGTIVGTAEIPDGSIPLGLAQWSLTSYATNIVPRIEAVNRNGVKFWLQNLTNSAVYIEESRATVRFIRLALLDENGEVCSAPMEKIIVQNTEGTLLEEPQSDL